MAPSFATFFLFWLQQIPALFSRHVPLAPSKSSNVHPKHIFSLPKHSTIKFTRWCYSSFSTYKKLLLLLMFVLKENKYHISWKKIIFSLYCLLDIAPEFPLEILLLPNLAWDLLPWVHSQEETSHCQMLKQINIKLGMGIYLCQAWHHFGSCTKMYLCNKEMCSWIIWITKIVKQCFVKYHVFISLIRKVINVW